MAASAGVARTVPGVVAAAGEWAHVEQVPDHWRTGALLKGQHVVRGDEVRDGMYNNHLRLQRIGIGHLIRADACRHALILEGPLRSAGQLEGSLGGEAAPAERPTAELADFRVVRFSLKYPHARPMAEPT